MTVYVFDHATGKVVEKVEAMRQPGHAIIRDIEPYKSPVGDHAVIGSRSARREDMRRHGCIDYREIKGRLPYGGLRHKD